MKRREFVKLTALAGLVLSMPIKCGKKAIKKVKELVSGRILYYDHRAKGKNDGSSWENAFTSIVHAYDKAKVRGIIYCRGSEKIDTTIESPPVADSPRFVGCSASDIVNETKHEIKYGRKKIKFKRSKKC